MKVCVIGTGRMGRRHIDAARGLGFDVVGIHDPFQDAMNIAVKDHGMKPEQCFANEVEMLTKLRPEGVVISSTAPGHAPSVLAAAKAGAKYILCEKPLAQSLAQCDEMIRACDSAGAVLGVNHQMRFMEQYTLVKEMVNSPEFGGLQSINVTASNFGLAMNGCHYFEMFRFMTDENISDIQFWADQEKVPNPRGAQFVDHSGQLRARAKSGKHMYMELGGSQGHGVYVIYGCRFGQIFVDELTGFMRATYRKPEFRELPTTRYGMPAETILRDIAPADVIGPTQALWKAMIEKKNYPDGQAGRHALAALVAANVSLEENGKIISLDSIKAQEGRIFQWA